MRRIIAICLAAGCAGDAGEPGATGQAGEAGAQGAQGAKGDDGEKGVPEDNIQYVDADGNAIARFAIVPMSRFPVSPAFGGMPVVFDADQNIWQVSFDATTQAATATPLMAPAMTWYTGADCTGTAVYSVPGTAARNVIFQLQGDSTIRRLPNTNRVSYDLLSSHNGSVCSNFSVTLIGFAMAATATTLVPPTLTWKGPIKAKWVE